MIDSPAAIFLTFHPITSISNQLSMTKNSLGFKLKEHSLPIMSSDRKKLRDQSHEGRSSNTSIEHARQLAAEREIVGMQDMTVKKDVVTLVALPRLPLFADTADDQGHKQIPHDCLEYPSSIPGFEPTEELHYRSVTVSSQ